MLEEGSANWWTTDLKSTDYNAKAQDPLYHASSAGRSADMIAEHLYNSLVEAEYLRDTQKLSDANGFTDHTLVEMLVLGNHDLDLGKMRGLVDSLATQVAGSNPSTEWHATQGLGMGRSSGYYITSQRQQQEAQADLVLAQ